MKKNDIALIRLKEKINFSISVRPACLQLNAKDENPSTVLFESGWCKWIDSNKGRLNWVWPPFNIFGNQSFPVRHNNKSEPMLKEEFRSIPLLECNRTVLEYNKRRRLRLYHRGIGRNQFCAYDPNDVTEKCQISSGGALQMFPSNAMLPTIVGVTSFRIGDGCNSRQPAIFTRIANYVPWIEANVWPFERSKYQLILAPNISTIYRSWIVD